MKRQFAASILPVPSLLLALVVSVSAQDESVPGVRLEEPRAANKNRFGVSYRMGFNITAEFKNVGAVAQKPGSAGRGPGPARGGGIDRFYDDGYNRVDSSGSRDGLTWHWGYRNESQILDDTVVMHSRSAHAISTGTTDDDPQHGFEITYNRELGVCEKTGWRWGVEGAFGWTDIDIRDDRPLAGGVRLIADAFDLGGVDPSRNRIPDGASTPPPYKEKDREFHPGTFNGPGPLIDDSPNRTVSYFRNGSRVSGSRRFDADLWTYRLGPYVDMPIDDRWTFSVSAGAALGVLDGEFSYRQLISTESGRRFQSGSGSNAELIYGGYLSALIHCAINENWGLFLGGQYVGLTCYDAEANHQKVEIDFGTTAQATMGVSFSF